MSTSPFHIWHLCSSVFPVTLLFYLWRIHHQPCPTCPTHLHAALTHSVFPVITPAILVSSQDYFPFLMRQPFLPRRSSFLSQCMHISVKLSLQPGLFRIHRSLFPHCWELDIPSFPLLLATAFFLCCVFFWSFVILQKDLLRSVGPSFLFILTADT